MANIGLLPQRRAIHWPLQIFSKREPLSASYGIGQEVHDQEGRVITLEWADFYLVNVYTPNSRRDLERLPYRMEWEDAFRAYLLALDARKPVIVCGDMNVAHQEIDLKNSKSNVGNSGFTYEEREKMSELLRHGFVDSFRHVYPDREGAYTWWSYMGQARSRNIGWRIDYFLVSDRIRDGIREATIYSQIPAAITPHWAGAGPVKFIPAKAKKDEPEFVI